MWFFLPLWDGSPRSTPALGIEPLRKDLQEPLFAQAGKRSSQEARQASLPQGKIGLTVPGGARCQSVWHLTGALLTSAPPLHGHPNQDPGLLGEGFGCGFVKTAKGYCNEKSLRGKGEHCMVLLQNSVLYKEMGTNAKKLGVINSCDKIYEEINLF